MVRYFISYVRYTSSQAMTISLILGTSVTVSLTLLLSAVLLAIFQPLLFLGSATNLNLRTTRVVLHSLSSLTLLGPAIVNLVFTFVWRRSPDDEVRVEGRCHIDVDVIWSGPSRRCDTSFAPPWRVWLALAALRVFLTAVVVVRDPSQPFVLFTLIAVQIAYHLIARIYHLTRRPSSRRYSFLRSRRPNLPESKIQSEPSVTSPPPTTYLPQKPPFVMSLNTPRTSRTTLVSPSRTTSHPSLYGSPRSHRSSRTFYPSGTESITPRRSSESALKSTSVDTSGDDLGSESSRRSSRTRLNEPLVGPDTTEEDSSKTEGGEMQTVAGRLRAILTQMTRETDEALDLPPITFANPSSPVTAGSETADLEQDTFNPYEDYTRPRATRDHVRVLGGYIRRMPTIESLSSREIHSSLGHRDNGNGGAGAPPSSKSSRPSTRDTGKSSKNQSGEPSSHVGSVGHATGRSGTPEEVATPPDDAQAHSVRSFDERNHGSSRASSLHDTSEHSDHHLQEPNG
jgi:hypothetical protein